LDFKDKGQVYHLNRDNFDEIYQKVLSRLEGSLREEGGQDVP